MFLGETQNPWQSARPLRLHTSASRGQIRADPAYATVLRVGMGLCTLPQPLPGIHNPDEDFGVMCFAEMQHMLDWDRTERAGQTTPMGQNIASARVEEVAWAYQDDKPIFFIRIEKTVPAGA